MVHSNKIKKHAKLNQFNNTCPSCVTGKQYTSTFRLFVFLRAVYRYLYIWVEEIFMHMTPFRTLQTRGGDAFPEELLLHLLQTHKERKFKELVDRQC